MPRHMAALVIIFDGARYSKYSSFWDECVRNDARDNIGHSLAHLFIHLLTRTACYTHVNFRQIRTKVGLDQKKVWTTFKKGDVYCRDETEIEKREIERPLKKGHVYCRDEAKIVRTKIDLWSFLMTQRANTAHCRMNVSETTHAAI